MCAFDLDNQLPFWDLRVLSFCTHTHTPLPVFPREVLDCKSGISKFLFWLLHLPPSQLYVFYMQILFILPSISLLSNSTFSLLFHLTVPDPFPSPVLSFSSNNLLSPSHCPALHQRPSETLADSQVLFSETWETLAAPSVTNVDTDLI